MKLKCTQENLAKALAIVSKAVAVKASLPILGNILFTAKDGVLVLESSNLETSIQTTLHASVDQDGAVAVPAKLFNEFISTLTSGALELATEGNFLKVDAHGSSAKFICMPAEDFPAMPVAKKGLGVTLVAQEFSFAVQLCSFCAAVGDSRPALTGVLLKKLGGDFFVVATDGFRLSEKILALDESSSGEKDFSLLVSAKTLGEIARMLGPGEDLLKLTFSESENLAVFEIGETTVSIRILDGEFPDYKRVIPTTQAIIAHAKTAEFLQSIKLANVFAKDSKEGNNLLRLTINPLGECLVYSATAQSGEGSVKLSLDVEGTESQTLNFNSKYLLDFLNTIKCDQLDIYSSGETAPCLFKSPQIDNFLHLIMPVKINA